MKRLCLLILLSLQVSLSSAQFNNLRFDGYNVDHNQALLDYVLLNVLGEDTISNWLASEIDFFIECTTDYHTGKLLSLDMLRKKKPLYLDEHTKTAIITFANENNILFPACYDYMLSYNYREKLFWGAPERSTVTMILGFPGPWVYLQIHNSDTIQTKPIESFKSYIKQYGIPTIRELLVRDKCIIYRNNDIAQQDNDTLILPSVPTESDNVYSVHYDPAFFEAYDRILEASLIRNRTIYYESPLFWMNMAISTSDTDYDYGELLESDFLDWSLEEDEDRVPSITNSEYLESIKNRFHLNDDGLESPAKMLYILGILYIEKYGCFDYFPRQCLMRISEIE